MPFCTALFSVPWLPLLFFTALLLPFLLLRPKKTRSSLPPSPPKLRIIGHLHHIGELPHRSLWLLSQKHGPLMHLQLGRVPTLVVSSAQMAREVMKTHDSAFCNRPSLTPFKKRAYDFSDIAFSPYTKYWREMRKICILQLLSARRVQSFGFVREEEVASMVKKIASSAQRSPSTSINLSEMQTSLNHKILCRVAFGRSFEGGSEGEKMRLQRAVEEAGKMLGGWFVGDLLPWLWWVDIVSGMRRRMERCSVELDAFYEDLIKDHIDAKRVKAEEEDFVDVLLRVQEEFHLSRHQVKGILMVSNLVNLH